MVDGETDAASRLGDEGALLQRVVNAVQRIVLHRQEEARRHLGHGCTGIEQGRRGVSEVAFAHQVVGVECLLDVGVVNADGHAHQHVLWTLCDFAVELEKVRTLEGLESKVVVGVITAVVDVVVENIGVGHDDFVDFL